MTSTHRSPILAGSIGAAAAFLRLAAAPGSAHASDQDLLLSSDGETYAQSLTHPVFGTVTGYIPGSYSSADIWVRNNTNDRAYLSVAVLEEGPATALSQNLGLHIRSPLGSTARVPLSGPGSCSDLVVGWVIAPGESARLTLTLDLDLAATNATRRQSTAFAFRFLLQDQTGPTPRGACSPPGATVIPGLIDTPSQPTPAHSSGPLAFTGAPDFSRWLLLTGAALATGSGILIHMRRAQGRNT